MNGCYKLLNISIKLQINNQSVMGTSILNDLWCTCINWFQGIAVNLPTIFRVLLQSACPMGSKNTKIRSARLPAKTADINLLSHYIHIPVALGFFTGVATFK